MVEPSDASDADGAGADDPNAGHPEEGAGVFGEAAPAAPVEPGSPSIENAAFVLLGVASTVALILHLVSLLG